MYFDDGDSSTPDPWEQPGRQPVPGAPDGYTMPTNPSGLAPTPPPTTPPPVTPAPVVPPPGSDPHDYPNLPNPLDSQYAAPALPTLRPPPPAFHAPDPLAPWTEQFSAPTAEQAANEPGFQFQLGEGLKALERSAAAKGTLLTGGTGKGEAAWATDFANTNYGNVYDRAANEYEGRRGNFLTNEANRYNSQVSNERNRYDTEYQNWAGQYGQEAGLFDMGRANRMDSWGIGSDYFNMGQLQRMNDFNIWDVGNANSISNLLKLAQIKKPASPYGPF